MSLDVLQSFDIGNSDITVWVVKKSGGQGDAPPVFTARWIESDDHLDGALKLAVDEARAEVEEVKPYDLLAQNNEASALSLGVDETHAPLVLGRCAEPTGVNRAKNLQQLSNSDFYVLKFVAAGGTILAFRKTDRSWRSKATKGLFSVVFAEEKLTLDERPRFSLSAYVDFFVIGDDILILNKAAFESILSYKLAHLEDFTALQEEAEFSAVFTNTAVIATFVGVNKIHLRRASAIKAKGHYKDPDFMQRLRTEAAALHLNIAFDNLGRIDPTPDTCRDIFQALLDHRLDSRLSQSIYDVDNAQAI